MLKSDLIERIAAQNPHLCKAAGGAPERNYQSIRYSRGMNFTAPLLAQTPWPK